MGKGFWYGMAFHWWELNVGYRPLSLLLFWIASIIECEGFLPILHLSYYVDSRICVFKWWCTIDTLCMWAWWLYMAQHIVLVTLYLRYLPFSVQSFARWWGPLQQWHVMGSCGSQLEASSSHSVLFVLLQLPNPSPLSRLLWLLTLELTAGQ